MYFLAYEDQKLLRKVQDQLTRFVRQIEAIKSATSTTSDPVKSTNNKTRTKNGKGGSIDDVPDYIADNNTAELHRTGDVAIAQAKSLLEHIVDLQTLGYETEAEDVRTRREMEQHIRGWDYAEKREKLRLMRNQEETKLARLPQVCAEIKQWWEGIQGSAEAEGIEAGMEEPEAIAVHKPRRQRFPRARLKR